MNANVHIPCSWAASTTADWCGSVLAKGRVSRSSLARAEVGKVLVDPHGSTTGAAVTTIAEPDIMFARVRPLRHHIRTDLAATASSTILALVPRVGRGREWPTESATPAGATVAATPTRTALTAQEL